MPAGKLLRRVALCSAPLAMLAISQPSFAQYAYGASALHAGALEVPLNKSQVVSTDRAIAKAMIGNADIADVLPITDRSVYVLGKTMGTTSLTLYDRAGRVLSIMDIAVGPDVQAFRDQAAQLMPSEKIEAHISGGAMVLTGLVSSPAAADKAVRLASTYAGDKVINMMGLGSSQQVMLEVRFAEVSRATGTDVSVSSFLSSQGFTAAIGPGARLLNGALGLGAITNSFGIFRGQFSVGGLDIDTALSALEARGLAKTLASPTLVALSGEKASFLAGGEFPVPVTQGTGAGVGGNTAITVEFKPFGVSLGFTPTVLDDKTINLIVEPEVSEIDPSASVNVGNGDVPGIKTRRASTTLEMRDGESFAIAGLLQRDFKTTINQMPILGSLPIIGALFKSSKFQKGETELLIVVTPRLVAPIRPDQVRMPTDRVQDPTQFDTVFMPDRFLTNPLPPNTGPASGQSAPPVPAPAPQSAAPAQPATPGGDYAY